MDGRINRESVIYQNPPRPPLQCWVVCFWGLSGKVENKSDRFPTTLNWGKGGGSRRKEVPKCVSRFILPSMDSEKQPSFVIDVPAGEKVSLFLYALMFSPRLQMTNIMPTIRNEICFGSVTVAGANTSQMYIHIVSDCYKHGIHNAP